MELTVLSLFRTCPPCTTAATSCTNQVAVPSQKGNLAPCWEIVSQAIGDPNGSVDTVVVPNQSFSVVFTLRMDKSELEWNNNNNLYFKALAISSRLKDSLGMLDDPILEEVAQDRVPSAQEGWNQLVREYTTKHFPTEKCSTLSTTTRCLDLSCS